MVNKAWAEAADATTAGMIALIARIEELNDLWVICITDIKYGISDWSCVIPWQIGGIGLQNYFAWMEGDAIVGISSAILEEPERGSSQILGGVGLERGDHVKSGEDGGVDATSII